MKMPAYVSLVTDSQICLSGGVGDVRAPLRHSPLSARLGRHEGYLSISFTVNSGQSADFSWVLNELNKLGLAFAEDHAAAVSPAQHMRELQSQGKLRAAFMAIEFHGPGDWKLTEYPA